MLRDVVGLSATRTFKGGQPLELQQRYFKDLSGGLDQHMRSLTHLLAAGWPRQVPPGGFSRAWGDECHSWLCGCSDCLTWVHVTSLEGSI